ncbi:tyrosine-type recombinase/integrase [Roseobacter litoralis]|uniref:tyrosine-type recombinase/integrase n=1 Tax=Roseobacter litoralis TaxID=42443 RepID=UPI0024959EB6|nr:tyrosine-type recombinase/integrase [Roseobacter litoralis]
MADIEQFRDYWDYGTKQRLAFELQYWAGARISDTRNLGPNSIDENGWLTFTQQKTGSEVSVPIYRALPEFADHEDLEHLMKAIGANPVSSGPWLITEYGKIRSLKGASQWFSKMSAAAGLKKKTSHGLRKSRMIRHAENGASSKQIAAWSGHETLKEIERYVQGAVRRKLLTPSVLETGKFL